MRTISVAEIRIDSAGRLLVAPELAVAEDFRFIYRAAMEITWEDALRALASPPPRAGGWSPAAWFRQIVKAVSSEYGANLVVSPDTRWLVPDELRREIENASKV